MKLKDMWRQRRSRTEVYSKADYWDSKASQLSGAAVSMWANNHLNALYEPEQLEWLDSALGEVEGRDIVDVGCGTGRICRYLTERGARVTGIDFSPAVIDIARSEPGPEVTYRVASIFDIDDDAQYDAAVAWGMLTVACRDEHDLAKALANVRAALRPGGSAVMLEPIHTGFLSRVLSLSLKDFCEVVEAQGLEIERVDQLHFWPARLALAYFEVPQPVTRAVYSAGEGLMRVPGLRGAGDYKAIVVRAE